jgi:hypothetical protein
MYFTEFPKVSTGSFGPKGGESLVPHHSQIHLISIITQCAQLYTVKEPHSIRCTFPSSAGLLLDAEGFRSLPEPFTEL